MALFVSDLDDTLLSRGVLPANASNCLRELLLADVLFTVATSRGLGAAIEALGDVIPKLPLVTSSGGVIAFANGETLICRAMQRDAVEVATRVARNVGGSCCLLISDRYEQVAFVLGCATPFLEWSLSEAGYFKEHTIIRERGPVGSEWERVVRVVLCGTAEQAIEASNLLVDSQRSVSVSTIQSRGMPGYSWLEIGAWDATKRHAVAYVAALCGHTLEETVYYGDSANDLDVMRAVGESVAVSNAEADVLVAADRIIGDASSGAVAEDIRRNSRKDLGDNDTVSA